MARTWSAVLARMGVPTGDGRILSEGGAASRDLPLPLLYQAVSSEGHDASVVIGAIESMQFGNGMITATGRLLDSAPETMIEQLEAGVIGPSVDLDDIEYVMDDQERIVITQFRVAGATLVAIPAFADVSLTLDPLPVEPVAEAEQPAMDWLMASAAAPLPPSAWFSKPDVDRLTPLTVTPEGRVFGHVAPWDQCHVGLPGCVTPPSSASSYSYFMVGEQRTEDGHTLPVGTLTVGGGHADAQLGFRAASEHYDDVAAAVARVSCGEDEFGIWVAGWMIPDADPVRAEQFMSSPVSGDWRRVGGALELIAICSVNSPGFPVPRARVAFSNQAQRALIGNFGVIPVADDLRGTAEVKNDNEARSAWARAAWKAGN